MDFGLWVYYTLGANLPNVKGTHIQFFFFSFFFWASVTFYFPLDVVIYRNCTRQGDFSCNKMNTRNAFILETLNVNGL